MNRWACPAKVSTVIIKWCITPSTILSTIRAMTLTWCTPIHTKAINIQRNIKNRSQSQRSLHRKKKIHPLRMNARPLLPSMAFHLRNMVRINPYRLLQRTRKPQPWHQNQSKLNLWSRSMNSRKLARHQATQSRALPKKKCPSKKLSLCQSLQKY